MRQASGYLAAGVAALVLICADSAGAGRPTLAECFEGSDFIANAARSRDAGMSGQAFLAQMRDDFETIQSVPADLRWFVHDADDEAFLLAAASEVFVHPGPAERHRRVFLQACVERMAG